MPRARAAHKIGGMTTTTTNFRELALRSIEIMGDGSREDFDEYVHPDFLNHEGKDEPPAARGRGPAACWATALWLRAAYADLHWEIHDVVVEGNLVVVHCTMSGRHAGPFVVYDARRRQAGVPADRQDVRHDPDALDARARGQDHRALGQPRRHGHRRAARLDAAVAAVPPAVELATRKARRELGA